MFDNTEIAPDDLPTTDRLDWQALDSRYARRLQVQALLTGLLALIVLVVIGVISLPVLGGIPLGGAVCLLVAITASGVVWPLVSVPCCAYAVRERDVVYRSGVLWRSVAAIPFNRVQHVETSSTPLDRRFRLATLQLYTAGGTGGDLKIHGLPATMAERMRVFVLEHVGEDAEQD